MANWAKLQEDTVGLPVFKRAKHGIHFDNGDGQVLANFSGKPCHYLDGRLWKPIDTKLLLLPDGSFGSPHSDVRIHPDGFVRVTGSDYEQFTKLPSAKKGVLAGDRIIRSFPSGEQHLIMTEDGFRQEIHVEKPIIPIEKFIARQTGNLPSKYKASPITARDANENRYEFTGDIKSFGDWLDGAKYPVVIDPDFGGSGCGSVLGYSTDYSIARSTSYTESLNASYNHIVGQSKSGASYIVYRVHMTIPTLSIGGGSEITQVNLKLTSIPTDYSTIDFDVQIVKWAGGATRESRYDNAGANPLDDSIWRNTSGMSTGVQYSSGNLSTAWVNKTGNTLYALRSNRDTNATLPVGYEYSQFAGTAYATVAYRPVLTVLYIAGLTGAVKILPNSGLVSLGSGGVRIRPTGGIRL